MGNSKCLLLVKAQLRSEYARSLRAQGDIFKNVIFVLLGGLIAYYAYKLASLLGSMGMAEVIPSLGIAVTSLMVLYFTVLKTNGILFSYKEYNMLMSFPIKTSVVIASRFFTIYVMNLILAIVVMLPMGAGYVRWSQPNAAFYPEWIVGILVAPLFPTTIAVLLGMLVILISLRFKRSNMAVMVLFPFVLAAIVGLPFLTGGGGGQSMDLTQIKSVSGLILRMIDKIYLPAALFYGGIVKQQIFKLLAYAIGSVVFYYIFIKVVSILYKRLNTALAAHHVRVNYRVTVIKGSSQMAALYKKEVRKFFQSPMYCLNMGLGTVLAAAVAVGSFFVGNQTMAALLQPFGANGDLTRTFPFIIGTLAAMTCTTSVSLSLEGNKLWIIKTLPLRNVTIYKSKMLFNLTLQLPGILLAALCLNIRFSMPVLSRVMILVIPLGFALFGTACGMLLNLKMPNYEWSSEVALVRRSMPPVCVITGALLIGGGMSCFSTQLQEAAVDIYMLVIAVFLLAGAYCLWCFIKKQRI